MTKGTGETTFVLLVALLCGATPALGQFSNESATEHSGVDVRAMTTTDRELAAGPLRAAISSWGARLAQEPPADVNVRKRTWVARHPVLLGTLIGAGAAAGLAGRHGGANMGLALALGAGAGATAGLAFSGNRHARLSYEAATPPDPQSAKRFLSDLGTGRRVSIAESNGRRMTGQVEAIGPDRVTLAPDPRSGTIDVAYADIRAIRTPQRLATKIGLAAGVIGGVTLGVMCAAYCGGN